MSVCMCASDVCMCASDVCMCGLVYIHNKVQ